MSLKSRDCQFEHKFDGRQQIKLSAYFCSRLANSAAIARDAPTPAMQAGHPKRSKTCPSTALPTMPPRK